MKNRLCELSPLRWKCLFGSSGKQMSRWSKRCKRLTRRKYLGKIQRRRRSRRESHKLQCKSDAFERKGRRKEACGLRRNRSPFIGLATLELPRGVSFSFGDHCISFIHLGHRLHSTAAKSKLCQWRSLLCVSFQGHWSQYMSLSGIASRSLECPISLSQFKCYPDLKIQ